ncbi:hypothetical protein ACFXTN_001189 [Malus domestica]
MEAVWSFCFWTAYHDWCRGEVISKFASSSPVLLIWLFIFSSFCRNMLRRERMVKQRESWTTSFELVGELGEMERDLMNQKGRFGLMGSHPKFSI